MRCATFVAAIAAMTMSVTADTRRKVNEYKGTNW